MKWISLSQLWPDQTGLFRKHDLNPRHFSQGERERILPLLQCGVFDSVPDGCVVYDIGANVGKYALLLARLPCCRTVVAWEPLPSVFEALAGKAQGNPKLVLHNVALGQSNGRITMFEDKYNQASSLLEMEDRHRRLFPMSGTQIMRQVDLRALDLFVREKQLPLPHFVKMDVQGFEKEVILGGMETMRAAQWCLLELSLLPIYKKGPLISEIMELMESLGLRLMHIIRELRGCDGSIICLDGLFGRPNAPTPTPS